MGAGQSDLNPNMWYERHGERKIQLNGLRDEAVGGGYTTTKALQACVAHT